MIKDYLHYFYQIENHWLKTVHCYSRYITAFDLFLKDKGKTLEHPENVDFEDIEEFVEHLRGRWCCANTCNFYLFWIKSFFKFCYLHNIKALDYLKIVFAKKEKIKIEACCEGDIRKLITSIKETNYKDKLDLKNVSLSLSVEKLQYDNMDEFIESKLQQSLQNVQLKKDTKSTENLLQQLEKPDLVGQLSFWNWLELLKKFLKKQYLDDYEEYEKLLQEMKIL